jgi:serine phosphatase RsbU (regulator of sigma subunit)/anti-sigma regulatory factor (Ser/Thr protein kinase)
VPVRDAGGRVSHVLHRIDDLTPYVRDREGRMQAEALRSRVARTEADLYVRARELQAALRTEELSRRRFAALADVAVELAGTGTVKELADVVVGRGLTALGADGGAVGVTEADGRTLLLDMTGTLGAHVQGRFGELPLSGPLPASVAADRGEWVVLPDRAASLRFASEMADVLDDTALQAWASLPLRIGDRVFGSLTVGWREAQRFGPEDVAVLDAFAALCAQTLDRILVRQAEQESSRAVRRLSETLQRSMLTAPPEPDHLEVAVRYQPAAEEAQVGGDWYDAFMIDGATTLVIGDGAGHDRNAAATMGQLRNLLRGVAYACGEPPARVLAELDRAMHGLGVDTFATVLLARIEQDEVEAERGLRRLRWSNAGHLPPLLLHPDGRTELLWRPADLPLQVDADRPRHDHDHLLPPGSTVLLYTDGLVERRDAVLDEGLDWLCASAGALADRPLEEFCDALLAQLPAAVDDDIALLAIRAHPEDVPAAAEDGDAEEAVELPASPSSPRRARLWLRTVLGGWEVADEVLEDATLVVTELVANAVDHAGTPSTLTVRRGDGELHVRVRDTRPGPAPQLRAVDPHAPRGRGLQMVDALAAGWGVTPHDDGKTVWAVLPVARG